MAFSARISQRPLHPLLIPFPIALFVAAFLCDITRLVTSTSTPYWGLAYYSIAGGIIGGLIAGILGFVEYLLLSQHEIRRMGFWHMLTSTAVVLLFVINFYLRRPSGSLATGGGRPLLFLLSSAGILLLGISVWLGSGLVFVHGVGVQPVSQDHDK